MPPYPTPEPNIISLPDERKLAWHQVGPADGLPVLYFHGLMGSRLQLHPDQRIATELGLRIITTDRPWVGRSTRLAGRRIIDWPADVKALVDSLNLDRFAVIGVSGGCPYAIATAIKLGKRVSALSLVSGMGPVEVPHVTRGMMLGARLGFRLTYHFPWLVRLPLRMVRHQLRTNPDWRFVSMFHGLPRADLDALADESIHSMLVTDLLESLRQGTGSPVEEFSLLARPWGFVAAEIPRELPVQLWHGNADCIVPVAMGHYLAQAIPQCQASWIPDEGHFLIFRHYREILSALRESAAG